MSLSMTPAHILNISGHGDSDTLVDSLCQCLIAVPGKKRFLLFSLYLPDTTFVHKQPDQLDSVHRCLPHQLSKEVTVQILQEPPILFPLHCIVFPAGIY